MSEPKHLSCAVYRKFRIKHTERLHVHHVLLAIYGKALELCSNYTILWCTQYVLIIIVYFIGKAQCYIYIYIYNLIFLGAVSHCPQFFLNVFQLWEASSFLLYIALWGSLVPSHHLENEWIQYEHSMLTDIFEDTYVVFVVLFYPLLSLFYFMSYHTLIVLLCFSTM